MNLKSKREKGIIIFLLTKILYMKISSETKLSHKKLGQMKKWVEI